MFDNLRARAELTEKSGIRMNLEPLNVTTDHRAVCDMVRVGKVGQVHLVKISSRDPEPPSIAYVKSSGGIFCDMMIHDFDMARFLAGSEVTEVSACGAVLVDPAIGEAGDVDTAVVTLRFANGAISVIDNSRRSPAWTACIRY